MQSSRNRPRRFKDFRYVLREIAREFKWTNFPASAPFRQQKRIFIGMTRNLGNWMPREDSNLN